jgi:spore coat polysaccharide biosynthesis predicted glycosyltransferase SpsG
VADKAVILVIDSYTVSDSYIESLNKPGRLLVCYDDNALYKYSCDVIINGNLHAKSLNYSFGNKRPKMLLGGRYASLRPQFSKADEVVISENAFKIFLCFGGSDLRNFTPFAVSALQEIEGVKINAVLGGAAKCNEELKKIAGANVKILINPDNIAEIMAKSDIGIISAGSISLEASSLGLPSITIEQAGNQRLMADYMASNGLMEFLGDYESLDKKTLKARVNALLVDFERRKKEHKKLLSTVSKNGALNIAYEIAALLKTERIVY